MSVTDEQVFLGIKKSVTGQKWLDRLGPIGRNIALEIAQSHDIPELIARVLAGRGVDAQNTPGFLDPTLRDLMPDPSVMTDMDKAAERLCKAILSGEKVAVFGDYDVDGAASSALMWRFFDHFEPARANPEPR